MNSATGGGFALARCRDRLSGDDCAGGAAVHGAGATGYPICAEQHTARLMAGES